MQLKSKFPEFRLFVELSEKKITIDFILLHHKMSLNTRPKCLCHGRQAGKC